jgi:uncharacterized protein YlxW (UPF0749 family)
VTVSRYRLDRHADGARIWRDEAEAEKARADRLESELADLGARVSRLEQENGLLRSLVTGERAIQDLAAKVTTNHLQTLAALAALRGPQGLSERRDGPPVPKAPEGASEAP